MNKILIILGPTATGKTDLAIEIAKKINGEIVSADSRQPYKGLDIGTGKLPGKEVSFQRNDEFWEIDGIKVWMYDVVNFNDRYAVSDYVDKASQIIDRIIAEHKTPIIVGGTGFYIQGLIDGIPNLNIPIDLQLRDELLQLDLNRLQERLKKVSPETFDNLNDSDRKNKRRLLRSIELVMMNPYKDTDKKIKNFKDLDILKIGLTAPKNTLNNRIHLRLISRLQNGLIEEADDLHKNGLTFERMDDLGLEYRYLAKYLKGEIDKDKMTETLSVKIRQYAKRQLTWFKRDKAINWFDITDDDFVKKVEKTILDWYNLADD